MTKRDKRELVVSQLLREGRSIASVMRETGLSRYRVLRIRSLGTDDPAASESMNTNTDRKSAEPKTKTKALRAVEINTTEDRLRVNRVMLRHRLLDERIPNDIQIFEDLAFTSGPGSKTIRLKIRADGNTDRIDEYIEAELGGS